MKKLMMLAFIAIGFTAASCCKDPIIFNDDRNPGGGGTNPSTCVAVTVDQNVPDNIIDCIPNDKIQRAWIEGDYLKIEVAYSGCNQHDFELGWSGAYMKSNPAQVNIELIDKTGEQMCQAYFQHTLCYDLTKMRLEGSHELSVHLNGYMGGQLVYKY